MRSLKQFRSVRLISMGHAFVQNVAEATTNLPPMLVLGIGSRLRSPSSHSPSDLAHRR
jgi:hypothetical protein